jgi:hypothetical protein
MTGLRMTAWWAAVAGALLLAMGWVPLVAWADKNPNMAAWVQAIGSIAAILVAVWVTYRQNAHQAELARRAAADRQKALRKIGVLMIRHLAETAARGTTIAKDHEDTPFVRSLIQQTLKDASEPLERLPFHEMDDLDIAQLGLGLIGVVGSCGLALQTGEVKAYDSVRRVLNRANQALFALGEATVGADEDWV